ncbi:cytochrome c oxidase subunit 2A [Bacillus sp. DNRA2]|uniref:cytochrome c oxidase subunit 2A n=1 Tax=Bacillus sp. DNRA2 TaxID=2723053 RepID=UPI00145C72A1|nr:cytochrome c oxidase subunit 2A [Bacillus sp. DNRA2]NMD72444.1 cytochrome c oxidase subunit 2A [Bacillus sp. DNRA2]
MAKTELGNKTNAPIKHEEESQLKGTLVSVFLVALVLIGTWAGVYFMYVTRL